MTSDTKHKRTSFSIRTLLIGIAIIAILLAAYQYRKKSLKPDTTITAADVAWAIDQHICKIDVSDQQNLYGVQVVVFENSGKTKRWLTRIGGDSVIDTTECPMLIVSFKHEDGSVHGKLSYTVGTTSFTAKNLLQSGSVAWNTRPALQENYFYLISDSKTVGPGPQGFAKSSNKLAIELLRSPSP